MPDSPQRPLSPDRMVVADSPAGARNPNVRTSPNRFLLPRRDDDVWSFGSPQRLSPPRPNAAQNSSSSTSMLNFNDQWVEHCSNAINAICMQPDGLEYPHTSGETRSITMPWRAEQQGELASSAERLDRLDDHCAMTFGSIRGMVDMASIDRMFPKPKVEQQDGASSLPDLLRPGFDPEAAGAPLGMQLDDDARMGPPPARIRREVKVVNGVPQPRFSSPKFFYSDDEEDVVEDAGAPYAWMRKLLAETRDGGHTDHIGIHRGDVDVDMRQVTSFAEVRELIERHAPYGAKKTNKAGNSRGLHKRIGVPTPKALQTSFRRLFPGALSNNRKWLRPTSIQFRVFTRYCLATRVEIDLPKPDKEEREYMEKMIAGESDAKAARVSAVPVVVLILIKIKIILFLIEIDRRERAVPISIAIHLDG